MVTLFVDISIESISHDEYNKIPRKLINKRSNGFKQIKQFINKQLKIYLKLIILFDETIQQFHDNGLSFSFYFNLNFMESYYKY